MVTAVIVFQDSPDNIAKQVYSHQSTFCKFIYVICVNLCPGGVSPGGCVSAGVSSGCALGFVSMVCLPHTPGSRGRHPQAQRQAPNPEADTPDLRQTPPVDRMTDRRL